MLHIMVERSNAAHQPSSKRFMVMLPHSSSAMNFSGTPVSVMSITSNWQQFALQVEQVTFSLGKFTSLIVIKNCP
jgi:hypothetical protein